METVEAFKTSQKKTIEVLEKLLVFLETGRNFGVNVDEKLIRKVENGINLTENEKLKVTLIGGFSEGKTSIAAAWSEHYDKKTMKISQSESSNAIEIYPLGDIELIDTPGLFGFKETTDKEKYKDITKKYVSESHLVLYVMNPNNPIKESHKEELIWLFKDLNVLSRTVFVISRFDEEVDIEDNDDYERGFKIKKDNIIDRLQGFDVLQPNEEVSIVAISANPFEKGIEYWLENLDEFKNLSHIESLKEATTNKIKQAGNKNSLILSSQKSIVKDIFLREMPIAQERVETCVEESKQLNEIVSDIERELDKTQQKITIARTNLREFIITFFNDVILQAQGTSIETFNVFFQNNIGSEGIVLEGRIDNEFERQLGNTAREINKLHISFNAGVDHYSNVLGDMAFDGLKMGKEFMKNGFIKIDHNGVLAARDMLKLPIKFKPWGAIKFANGFNKAVPFVGEFLGIAIDVWDVFDQKKKEEEFKRAINEMVSDFNKQRKEYLSFIEDEKKFIPQFFPEYMDLLERMDIIKNELLIKEKHKNQFIKWRNDGMFIEAEFEEID